MIDLESSRVKLENEKKELLSEIKKIGISDDTDPGGFIAKETNSQEGVLDEADMASELENLGNNHAILIELEARLESVERALEAIEDGSYGKCEVCGVEIPEKRLMANVAATTCLEHGE